MKTLEKFIAIMLFIIILLLVILGAWIFVSTIVIMINNFFECHMVIGYWNIWVLAAAIF